MGKKMLLFTAILFVGLMIAMPSTGHALATLSLSDGVAPVLVIPDNGPLDTSPLLGVVTYNGLVGANWLVNITTGITMPVMGNPIQPFMDLNSIDVSGGAGVLNLMFSENNFALPAPNTADMWFGGTTCCGTVTYRAFFDNNNVVHTLAGPPPPGLIGTIGPLASPPNAFSGTLSTPILVFPLYSLTQQVTINHPLAGLTSFDASLKVTAPIPSAGLMTGTGLLLCLLGLRRKLTS